MLHVEDQVQEFKVQIEFSHKVSPALGSLYKVSIVVGAGRPMSMVTHVQATNGCVSLDLVACADQAQPMYSIQHRDRRDCLAGGLG